MDVESSLIRIGHRQIGLISRHQALAAGLTAAGIQTRLSRGDWRRVRRGVYAVAGVRPTVAQADLAVCLAVGDGCRVSHRSAAALWGLQVPRPDCIEVVTPTARRTVLPGVVQHRSAELLVPDVTRHRFVPVTTVARTLIDCIPHLPGSELGVAVDDALRRRLLRVSELAQCLGRLDHGRGRRQLSPLRTVLADRRPGYDPGGSQRELDVVGILVRGGLPAPVQQVKVVVGGRVRFIDHGYVEELVGLEFDGFAEHGLIRSTFDDDRSRGNDLAVAGWLMLHFTSNSPPVHIVARTAEALALRRRRPA